MLLIPRSIARKLTPGNPWPYLKLFTPGANATWLISEYDPETDTAFGLADLGLGFPELGYIYMPEIRDLRTIHGFKVERDFDFHPDKTITEYAKEAQAHGRITA